MPREILGENVEVLSEKVLRALRSKTDLTDDQLAKLTEGEAWNLIYAVQPAKKEKLLEVCITGFGPTEKSEITSAAESGGLKVVTVVTKNCAILVCGSNAGPSKLEQAAKKGAQNMTREEFMLFLDSGELPDSSTTLD
ncbi:MAG: BRCT domain-containing protein [bacterium]